MSVAVFWFRRDLRLTDNHGLMVALNGPDPVLPVFIFDTEIIDELPQDDHRITFIYDILQGINNTLRLSGSGLLCLKGKPEEVFDQLSKKHSITCVYCNEDYEPYAIHRDQNVKRMLSKRGVDFRSFKDQVIFEKDEVIKEDGSPYTVYTPYKNKWLSKFSANLSEPYASENKENFSQHSNSFPELATIGFVRSSRQVRDYSLNVIDKYGEFRDIPSLDRTSYLGPYLRFGIVSIRELVKLAQRHPVFLSELIWREFFMQILYHYPKVVDHNFKSKYDGIKWKNDPVEFEKWKNGETGYPIVDAGMRQLKLTGYMHNRVRMIVASFLCKHLLIDWRWGEAYFAEELFDYELASNNGNWQWAAGTGCDAAPYFRVFNPAEQTKKFDPDLTYIRKWVDNLESMDYPHPIVEHKYARERALMAYKEGIS